MARAARILLILTGVVGILGGLAQVGHGDGNGATYLLAAAVASAALLFLARPERA